MCGRFTQKMTWREIRTLYRMPTQTTALNLQLTTPDATPARTVLAREGDGAGESAPLGPRSRKSTRTLRGRGADTDPGAMEGAVLMAASSAPRDGQGWHRPRPV